MPAQSKEAPGNKVVRLSPSKIMNSTQYDYIWKKENIQFSIVREPFSEKEIIYKTKVYVHIILCKAQPAQLKKKKINKTND